MIPGQKESIADALAVLAVSRRDETAWATLYKQMWPFVRAIAYRRLGSVEGLADDAAQEVFARLGFTHICGKNGLGRFLVRRTTIRKRMRTKLREVKQQLRKRMHDSVPQTGGWLKSVVQGYFNYYAVPGNLASLGVFRDRVIALWWRTIRRRSQKRRISWTRTLALAQRWLPQPRALHPFPDARFAATHPR